MATVLPSRTEIIRDNRGVVRRISHAKSPYHISGFVPASPASLAHWYLEEFGSILGLEPSWLVDRTEMIADKGEEFVGHNQIHLASVKTTRDVAVVSYAQSYAGLPIFLSGVTVRVRGDLSTVISSQSSLDLDVDINRKSLEASRGYEVELTGSQLAKILGLGAKAKGPEVATSRLLIYRYLPENRIDPAIDEEDHPDSSPELKLPKVPGKIVPGDHYIVRDLLFSLELPGWGLLEWRALVEVETDAVLYLRAFVEGCSGAIFRDDPITMTGDLTNSSCAPVASLDALTEIVPLEGLTPSNPQALIGEYVQLMDTDAPTIAPPTATLPACEFHFSAASDDFAAVNAYYHMDSLYRMVDEMGFVNYFAGTSFPIPMDHRGENGGRNAHHHGTLDRTTKYRFGLAEIGCPVGIACDRRIVIHEFGHSVLRNHIDSGVFSFAHGVGDTLAVIMSDPSSQAPDRYDTFPFTTISRRHDRDIGSGWGWGGANDTGSYSSTQIMSTTMFRVYRSIGGDAVALTDREFAARFMTYLVLAAVGLETPMTQPGGPEDFAEDLIDADQGTTIFDGHPGGAFHKVVRWAFEKQDAYGGEPPEVDIYIDDGRAGEYPWLDLFTDNVDVWCRYEPDGGTSHQPPLIETPTFVYVRVKNRGTEAATDITVKSFTGPAGGEGLWPDHFTPLTTPELTIPGPIAPGGSEIVGPFGLTLTTTKGASILMSASTTDDVSNIETISGDLKTRRLVPHDNNLGQLDVAAIPYPVGYSVKFVCGKSDCGCSTGPVAPGSYFTAINILNPTDKKVRFRMKVAVALPGGRAGHVSSFVFYSLGPCEAMEFDCKDIYERVGLSEGCFLKGFAIIQSLVELDVVAVYSAAGADNQVETVDVEYIRPRLTKPEKPPEDTPRLKPDLIPLPAFAPPSPTAPGALPQNYCYSTTGGQRADAIRIRVRNQGAGNAAESITEVAFGNNGPIQVATPAIAAGAEALLDVMIPRGCFVGESSCTFKIRVDATSVLDESNEGNNDTSSHCPGIVS